MTEQVSDNNLVCGATGLPCCECMPCCSNRVENHDMKGEIRTCENCTYAEETDIDGLVICTIDNRSKDVEMGCVVVKE